MNLLPKGSINSFLLRGASWSLFIRIIGTLITLILQMILARIMGVSNYGDYAYSITMLVLMSMITKLGYDTSVLKYIPSFQSKNEWSYFKGFLKWANTITFISSICLAIIWCLYIFFWGYPVGNRLHTPMLLCCVLLPLFTSMQIRGYCLQSLKRIISSQLPQFILYPSLIGLGAIILSISMQREIAAYEVIILEITVCLCILIFLLLQLKKVTPKQAREAVPKIFKSEWSRVSLSLMVFSSFYLILNQIDTIIIGYLLDTKNAGIYASVNKVALLVTLSLTAINSIFAPIISQLHTQKKHMELQDVTFLANKCVVCYSVPVSILIIIFGKDILSFFGSEFVVGYSALLVLTIGQLVNAFAGSTGFLMTMTGNQNKAIQIMFICTIVNIILLFIFTPFYGLFGAAIATALTMISWNITLMLFVKKKVGIYSSVIGSLLKAN